MMICKPFTQKSESEMPDLFGKLPDGNTECASKSKICQFGIWLVWIRAVQQNVLWLQIPVHHPHRLTMVQSKQHMIHNPLQHNPFNQPHPSCNLPHLDNIGCQRPMTSRIAQQIALQMLKHLLKQTISLIRIPSIQLRAMYVISGWSRLLPWTCTTFSNLHPIPPPHLGLLAPARLSLDDIG